MYIPNLFQLKDKSEQIAFMKQYSFATMVTIKGQIPIATQLPFVIEEQADKLVLTSHFALANEQTKYLDESISLVIFAEPHAYISPTHYDKLESVPTWDYLAVHAYGKAKILSEESEKLGVLEKMIRFYEQDYLKQWDSLRDKFRKGMMAGIVAFELEVTDLQGQKKISQNKTEIERKRIVDHLEKSENTVERDIANYIKDL